MRRKAYIGITGFTQSGQIRQVLGQMPKAPRFALMCGVLASSKTFESTPRTKWAGRYPTLEGMEGIFVGDPRVLNVVHYHSSSRGQELVRELMRLRTAAQPYIHGFQLNMTWPSVSTLRLCQELLPDMIFVLQCGREAMQQVEDTHEMVEKIKSYNSTIQYALLDASGGHGTPLDTGFAQDFLRVFAQGELHPSPVIAGGLSADSISRIRGWSKQYGSLSIDAEGALRNDADELVIEKATAYLNAALKQL